MLILRRCHVWRKEMIKPSPGVFDLSTDSEITLICRQCGKEFIFSQSEQEFYKLKGFEPPLHCKPCRIARKNQLSYVCAACGHEITTGGPVYCSCCSNAVRLGYELDLRTVRKSLEESRAEVASLHIEQTKQADDNRTRLKAIESEKARLCEMLQQKKMAIAELERELKANNLELEKSLNNHVMLEALQPTLVALSERVEAIERAQIELSNRMLKLVQNSEKPVEESSILEMIRRLFRPQHRSPSLNR